MSRQPNRIYAQSPLLGCVLALIVMVLMCVWPLGLIEFMRYVLSKLHLHPAVTFLVVAGILGGSFVNFPIHRIEREVEQVVTRPRWFGWFGQVPFVERTRTETIVAMNLGGCIIPLGLAIFELILLCVVSPHVLWALGVAVAACTLVCYWVAKPVDGVGITMPALLPPVVAVGVTWLLLMPAEFGDARAPVAFVAGVMGPLVGADLLHLRDFSKVSVGVVSIGGAGTFDGIVLSGMLAALLA